jgi:hypothetical protein
VRLENTFSGCLRLFAIANKTIVKAANIAKVIPTWSSGMSGVAAGEAVGFCVGWLVGVVAGVGVGGTVGDGVVVAVGEG